jgi:hypothetical protein
LKKEIAEQLKYNRNNDEITAKLDQFNDQVEKEKIDHLYDNIKFAAPEVEKNIMDDKQVILLFENDKNALKEYFENIVQTRPEMIKETYPAYPYDWDFEIDVNNYDPWEEYKLIYKDLFQKGRKYYIIKSIPNWKFLEVGKAESFPVENVSEFNPKRHNNRDSIFTMLTIEKWFEEREKKEGTYRGKSQAIRI